MGSVPETSLLLMGKTGNLGNSASDRSFTPESVCVFLRDKWDKWDKTGASMGCATWGVIDLQLNNSEFASVLLEFGESDVFGEVTAWGGRPVGLNKLLNDFEEIQ